MTAPERGATVVAVLMGMGHLRAAYPLRHFAHDGVLIYGSKRSTPKNEYRIWRKIRKSYYFFSRAGEIPLMGNFLLQLLVWLQRIEPYYPRRDRSRPNFAVHYLDHLIKRRGLCRALIEKIYQDRLPVIHTYFATAIAADRLLGQRVRKLPFDLRQRFQPGLGAEGPASKQCAVFCPMHPGQTPPDVVRSTRGKHFSHRISAAEGKYRQRNRP